MKVGALLLLSASSLFAQTPFEIRGTVSEPGLGGIPGVEVQAGMTGVSAAPPVTTFTDGRGNFVVRTTTAGRYTFRPMRTGYLAVRETSQAQVDSDHPRGEVQLTMVRPAQVSGRILDADTLKPIEGAAPLLAQKVFDERGAFTWFPVYLPPPGIQLPPNGLSLAERDALLAQVMDELKPKSDGTFTISGATPGEYAITIAPASTQPAATSPKVRWTADFSPNDIKVIDEDYPVRFWPGDVQGDAVIPLSLGSGAVVSIGDLRPKKVPLYRAHISIAQGDCPEGEALRVSLFRSGESGFHTEVSPCGSEVLLGGLEPGNYFLYAVSDWQGERDQIENAVWASTQFQISDENIERSLVPQHGVVIEGQLVAAEGLGSFPERLSFGVLPEEVTPGFQPGLEQFLEWLPDRKFRMVVSPRSQTFSTSGPVYIKQLRYNGSPLLDLQVPIHPGSAAHHLEMVLDDKFGTIVGSVEGGQSQMILSLSSTRTLRPQMIQVENGSFRSGPLSPGEYRVTVTTRDDIGGTLRSPQPHQQVVVRAGETTTLNLRAPGTPR